MPFIYRWKDLDDGELSDLSKGSFYYHPLDMDYNSVEEATSDYTEVFNDKYASPCPNELVLLTIFKPIKEVK